MSGVTKPLFLLLILGQLAHSIEEHSAALWEVLAPARWVSAALGGSNLERGFIIANSAIVLFGFFCFFGPVLQSWPIARALAWFWCGLELLNGVGHALLAVQAGGYFPGLYTAPALVVLSSALAVMLYRTGGLDSDPVSRRGR